MRISFVRQLSWPLPPLSANSFYKKPINFSNIPKEPPVLKSFKLLGLCFFGMAVHSYTSNRAYCQEKLHPLFKAVSENDLEYVRKTFKNNEDLSIFTTKNADGNTLLHLAVLNKNEEMIIEILKYQGCFNMVNNDGCTACDLACENIDAGKLTSLLINAYVYSIVGPNSQILRKN